MSFEITVHGLLDGWKKDLFEPRKKPEAPQLILDRVLKLGKAQLDAILVQSLVQFLEEIGRCDVNAGQGFGRDDNQDTDVSAFATASRTHSLNSSPLAKNKGAFQRKRTRPGIWRALGYRVMS